MTTRQKDNVLKLLPNILYSFNKIGNLSLLGLDYSTREKLISKWYGVGPKINRQLIQDLLKDFLYKYLIILKENNVKR